MGTFNVKEYLPEAMAIYYTGPLDFTKVRCSKELINSMIITGERRECSLKTLLMSEEDMEDIKFYTENEVDEDTRQKIFEEAGARTWGINFRVDEVLNGSGVLVGLTEHDYIVIVGETGRYNENN